VRIEIKRRGGLAGVTLHAEVTTTDLDRETAAGVEKAIDGLAGSGASSSPSHPDEFSYDIGVPDRGVSVSVAEHDVPAELRPLTALVSKVGTVEDRSRRTA